jgi:hypothetical protein
MNTFTRELKAPVVAWGVKVKQKLVFTKLLDGITSESKLYELSLLQQGISLLECGVEHAASESSTTWRPGNKNVTAIETVFKARQLFSGSIASLKMIF